jgi:hypothetical protein
MQPDANIQDNRLYLLVIPTRNPGFLTETAVSDQFTGFTMHGEITVLWVEQKGNI